MAWWADELKGTSRRRKLRTRPLSANSLISENGVCRWLGTPSKKSGGGRIESIEEDIANTRVALKLELLFTGPRVKLPTASRQFVSAADRTIASAEGAAGTASEAGGGSITSVGVGWAIGGLDGAGSAVGLGPAG